MISLYASEERQRKLDRIGDPLTTLASTVDFAAIAAQVSAALPKVDYTRGGRPPFAVELMIRMLVLKQLYNLSDDEVEYQALDRASFQRFLGLSASSAVPDAKTFWSFQQALTKAQAGEIVGSAVQEQLARAGYSARRGQLIDATIVRAPVQHFTRAEKESLERGEIPEDWSAAKRAQKDLDASWTKKHGKSYFGYKAHASADVRCKLARKAVITPASEHDTHHFEDLLDENNTSREVCADKGYADREREAKLEAAGWCVNIQRKARRGKPLSNCQKRRNTRIAKTRARVEHVFAGLHQMGGLTIRTIGLARAQFQMATKLAVYNLKRWMSLRRCGVVAS